jgi:hypothetical protein
MSRRPAVAAAVLVTALTAALAAPASAAPAARKRSDTAIAEQGVLRLSDFPAGWQQSRHKDSRPSGIAACKATEGANAKAKRYRAQSPDFSKGDTTVAGNTVYVFPKVAQATAYLKPYQAAAAQACLRQAGQKALKKSAGATVQVQALDLSSAIQGSAFDDAVGYVVLLTIPGQPDATKLFVVPIAIRIGRSVTMFTTENAGEPLPETDSLLTASLTRLARALG